MTVYSHRDPQDHKAAGKKVVGVLVSIGSLRPSGQPRRLTLSTGRKCAKRKKETNLRTEALV